METRTLTLDTPDGDMALFEAVPDGTTRGAVVVIQEAFGVNNHILDVVGRFAEAGYHAVAPHLFYRTGSPAYGYDDFSVVIPHVLALTDCGRRVGLTGRSESSASVSAAGSPSWSPATRHWVQPLASTEAAW
jgi:dienelactone hydrolase